jgi:hypothetical protein
MRQPSRYRTPLRYRVPYMWTTPAPYVLAMCVVAFAWDYMANADGFTRYLCGLIAYALHG